MHENFLMVKCRRFWQNHVFKGGKEDDNVCSRREAALKRHGESEEALGDAEYHLVLEYKIGGPLTYVSASTHCKRFLALSVDHVLLNLSHVTRIDVDGIEALQVYRFGSSC